MRMEEERIVCIPFSPKYSSFRLSCSDRISGGMMIFLSVVFWDDGVGVDDDNDDDCGWSW